MKAGKPAEPREPFKDKGADGAGGAGGGGGDCSATLSSDTETFGMTFGSSEVGDPPVGELSVIFSRARASVSTVIGGSWGAIVYGDGAFEVSLEGTTLSSDVPWTGVGSLGGVALDDPAATKGLETLRGVGGALLLRKKPRFFKFGIAIGRGTAKPNAR